jgi:hypothetical protein
MAGVEIGQLFEIGGQSYMIGAQPSYQIGAGAAVPYQSQQPGMMRLPNGMQAIPMVQMRTPTLVKNDLPTRSKQQPLGCNQEVPILVGATGTAQVTPQRTYKPERWVIPDTVAPDFVIDGIFIGVDRQSPAIGGIAAESFGPSAIYTNVEFDTCQINMTILTNPRNRGGADRPFFSTFYGTTVY